MPAIDWAPFDSWPVDTTVECRCGTYFRSHAKATYAPGGLSIHSRQPCPSCGATEGHRAARSDPELMTIGDT